MIIFNCYRSCQQLRECGGSHDDCRCSHLLSRDLALGFGSFRVRNLQNCASEIKINFAPFVVSSFKGELKTTVELPHTISNWVGKALCVSETDGFGMSSPAEIEVFQPFFLELHLPYSVKRTEKLKLKVAVFNYAKQALPIRLTLDRSEAIQVVGNGTSDYSSAQLCVPPQTNLVHHFHVYATELGRHNITVTAAIDDAHPGECGSSSQQGARYSNRILNDSLRCDIICYHKQIYNL